MVFQEERIVKVFGRASVLLLLSFFVFVSCHGNKDTLPFYNEADFTPMWDSDTLQQPVHTIAAFSFLDQEGKSISNTTFNGKIYVANFFFTSCPGICPRMTSNIKKVANQFQNQQDVMFLSHSVTPWIDSIPRLDAFAKKYKIRSSQWHLVTGQVETINVLARQSYFAETEAGLSKDSTEFLHTEQCLLIDRKQRIRGVYNGTLELEMNRLADDIAILLKE
jgi:protein SCO1/2